MKDGMYSLKIDDPAAVIQRAQWLLEKDRFLCHSEYMKVGELFKYGQQLLTEFRSLEDVSTRRKLWISSI